MTEESFYSSRQQANQALRPWKHFDARGRLSGIEDLASDSESELSISAVFVPTKGRPTYASDSLKMLSKLPSALDIWLLESEGTDLPETQGRLYFRTPAEEMALFEKTIYRRLKTPKSAIGQSSCREWDLPKKRLFALWLSRRRGYKRILLLDDDVRDFTPQLFQRMNLALTHYAVAGALSDHFLDTSIAGHAARSVGIQQQAFLSGNCLALNLEFFTPFFPPIYNEDWLATLAPVRRQMAAYIGSIYHLPYDPFQSTEAAEFQEPGEVFTESLYELLAHSPPSAQYNSISQEHVRSGDAHQPASPGFCSFWEAQIADRTAWLQDLRRALGRASRAIHCIDAAINKISTMKPEDFANFYIAWIEDQQEWERALAGN